MILGIHGIRNIKGTKALVGTFDNMNKEYNLFFDTWHVFWVTQSLVNVVAGQIDKEGSMDIIC